MWALRTTRLQGSKALSSALLDAIGHAAARIRSYYIGGTPRLQGPTDTSREWRRMG
ncbi:hypothetical protein SAMD00023353_2901040 [Rosellinia necatrix]|uniref:Uncharacterized protein n=1 Tax=Rosellinia necatrix TaxID=77044 RepID=A0A1S8A8J4_ROSNE|nr:hypothetical protein SAMD00023353_2901040 [Rosellinia necatrix]